MDGHRLQVTNTTPHTPKAIQTVVWPTHRPPTIGELMRLNACPIDPFHPLGGNLPREPKERLAVGECQYSHSFQGQVRAERLNLGFLILAERAPGEVKKDNHTQASPIPTVWGGGQPRGGRTGGNF